MDKIWCRNNLNAIGKWGGTGFLFGLAVTAFMFGGNLPVQAYVIETKSPALSQPTQLNLDFNSSAVKLNSITSPLNNLINNAIKSFGLNRNTNIGTGSPLSPISNSSQGIDFSKFFSSSKVSSTDVMSFLKEAAVTAINLTILVFSIASQVLKGILGAIR